MIRSTSDIVFQISVAMNSEQKTESDGERFGEMFLLGESYAKAVKTVSERLVKCQQLLTAGSRAVAYEVATQAPDLREEVRVLDFPERREWEDICKEMKIELGPSLDFEAVGSLLTRVYGDTEVLERLLRAHRRMSIGRATLPERLNVLRQIRDEDPGNKSWAEDIRLFETARAEELAAQSLSADRAGDLAALEAILKELQSAKWSEPPARKYVAGVERMIVGHRKAFAVKRFAELAGELANFHAAKNEAGCQATLDAIKDVTRRTGADPDAGARAAVDAAQGWLNDLRAQRDEAGAYDAACRELEEALDAGGERTLLEKRGAAVLRFGRGLPENLSVRYSTRLDDLRAQERNRFVLRVGSIAAAAVVLIAVAVIIVLWVSAVRREAAWRSELTVAIEKNDLDAASKLLAAIEQDKKMASAPEIRNLKSQYEQKVAEEQVRKRSFEDTLVAIAEAGLDAPNLAAIDRAGTLARTAEEKKAVDDWRQKIAARRDETDRKRLADFDEKLGALRKSAEDLAAAVKAGGTDYDPLASECMKKADELVAMRDIPAERRGQAERVRTQLNALIGDAKEKALRQKTMSDALKTIPTLYDRPKDLSKALRAFNLTYPESPLAAEFAQDEKTGPAWVAAATWKSLLVKWRGELRVSDGAEATARLQQIDDYLAQAGQDVCPYWDAVQNYKAYLAAAAKAMPEGGLAGLSAIEEALAQPLFSSSLKIVRARDGAIFYAVRENLRPQNAGDKTVGYSFDYIVFEGGKLTTRKAYLNLSEMRGSQPEPAAQCVFSKTALDQIRHFRGTGWETIFLRLACLAQKQEEMDPIPRALVMRMCLQRGFECAPFRANDVRDMLLAFARVNSADLDIAWMDPTAEGVEYARARVKAALEGVKPADDLVKGVEQEVADMVKGLARYEPAGVLVGKPEELRLASGCQKGALFAVLCEGGRPPCFKAVGKVVDGKILFEAASRMPQGTLLYVAAD